MTGPVVPGAHPHPMDDALLELAILGILAERTEIYPSHLVGELRRRAPMLDPDRVRPVLERLWAERRVARLWHRYLLPDRVPDVRGQWLAMLERKKQAFADADGDLTGWNASRAILTAWDGWRMGRQAA